MKDVMTEDGIDKHDLLFAIKLNHLVLDLLVILEKFYESSSKLLLTMNADKLSTIYSYAVVLLEKLYEDNAILANNPFEPIWENIKTPKGNEIDIMLEFENGIFARQQKHTGELERIWLFNKDTKTELLPKEKQLLEKSNRIINAFDTELERQLKKCEKYKIDYDRVIFKLKRKSDYSLWVNDKKIGKPRNGAGEIIIDHCLKSPNQTIILKDCGVVINRHIQSILNDMGFTPQLRRLFFPITKKDRVVFRPIITMKMILDDDIDIHNDELKTYLTD